MIHCFDRFFGVLFPILFFVQLIVWIFSDLFTEPFGMTAWWRMVIYWTIPLWVALTCLAPAWAWLTRRQPVDSRWRRIMSSSWWLVRLIALSALVFALGAGVLLVQNVYRLGEDLRTGPVVEEGVVCSGMTWQRTSRGGASNAKMDFVLSDGPRVETSVDIHPDDLNFGFGKRLNELCESHDPFTLTWWPNTKIVADVR